MSMVNKSALGAGDGIANTVLKKRTPASSRRFATRGIRKDTYVKQKLQEALDNFSTPPQSPLKRRSLSIPDITPSKKIQSNLRLSQNKLERHETSKSRRDDAGRRVCHQLVLNAWRRRRHQVAALTESRNELQTQVNQLHMQVDFLQKLRAAEAIRRSEAFNECKVFKDVIEDLENKNKSLQQSITSLEEREKVLHSVIEEANTDLINERNNIRTISTQKSLCEQAFNREKYELKILREERNHLIGRIQVFEREIESEQKECKSLHVLVKMTEQKYVETIDKCHELEEKHKKLEAINEQQKIEIQDEEELRNNMKEKCDKLESKLRDIKKTLCSIKQQKRVLTDENKFLNSSILKMEVSINEQMQKQWWKSTGQFFITSFENVAYLLFPALPAKWNEISKLDVVGCSIGLGKL